MRHAVAIVLFVLVAACAIGAVFRWIRVCNDDPVTERELCLMRHLVK